MLPRTLIVVSEFSNDDMNQVKGPCVSKYVDPSTERPTPPSFLQPTPIERRAEINKKSTEEGPSAGGLL